MSDPSNHEPPYTTPPIPWRALLIGAFIIGTFLAMAEIRQYVKLRGIW